MISAASGVARLGTAIRIYALSPLKSGKMQRATSFCNTALAWRNDPGMERFFCN
jgi:hypothetical protein